MTILQDEVNSQRKIKCASGPKSKKSSQHALTIETKEISSNKQGSLVQVTIFTLFNKIEEKVSL